MSALEVRGLVAGFGGPPVLRGVDLDVAAGTTTAVLGPSGCGKTTLLRAVAGFVRPAAGSVRVDGVTVAGTGPDGTRWTPPERRGIGYVAQEGALFPHLSVADNVAFGLPRAQRRDRDGTRARVGALLELAGLDPRLASRRPHELSGGQQQRVALARALAPRPRLVLLDEPFSALDAGLRAATRAAVREALDATGVTVVLVTHDQGEALSFADDVALVRDGLVVQTGSPGDAYERPVDRAAAEFLGDAVVLAGTVTGPGLVTSALGTLPVVGRPGAPGADGDTVEVVVRPEQVRLGAAGGTPALVEHVTYFGHDALVDLRLAAGDLVRSRVLGAGLPATGDVVRVEVDGPALVYPAAAGPARGHPGTASAPIS